MGLHQIGIKALIWGLRRSRVTALPGVGKARSCLRGYRKGSAMGEAGHDRPSDGHTAAGLPHRRTGSHSPAPRENKPVTQPGGEAGGPKIKMSARCRRVLPPSYGGGGQRASASQGRGPASPGLRWPAPGGPRRPPAAPPGP